MVNEADEGLKKLLCILSFVLSQRWHVKFAGVHGDLIERGMGSGNLLACLQTLFHARLPFNK